MTVKPEDCLKLTTSEVKIVADMEKVIDAQLRDQFTVPGTIVKVAVAFVLNERVYNKISNMYSMAGWEVRQSSSGGGDMRPGLDPVIHYLEFSQAKRSGSNYQDRDTCGGPYDR